MEFKRQVPDKELTPSKLSSFVSAFDGLLVVGARADSTNDRIRDLPGVDDEPSYKQKVVHWRFGTVSLPVDVEVSDPIPAHAGNGKFCYVIKAAESDVAPQSLNGRKGVWVRTDEFSARFEPRLANEDELRNCCKEKGSL